MLAEGTSFEFYYVHYSLYVEQHRSLEDAVGMSAGRSDAGTAAIDHIETVENGVLRVLSRSETDALVTAKSNAWGDASKTLRDAQRKPIGQIVLVSPDGDYADLNDVYDEEAVISQLAELAPIFGERALYIEATS